jgi:ABC-type transport system involved in multi-copper enzyme maturation permease subunit
MNAKCKSAMKMSCATPGALACREPNHSSAGRRRSQEQLMNPLVKKEIRLLLPSLIVAVLLAMVQGITRPYDFYVASVLFFGLTIMALTTFGRETSHNTFSLLMSQPTERTRIWQTKLSVLVVAFLIVFAVWLAAFGIAFMNSDVDASDTASSYNLFIAICLIATATFSGGLWTTLLLRQIAGAFWLTLLVPAVLAGFTAAFLAEKHSDNAIVAVLCVVLGIYSVGGFLFARWLFFRAQDVGWSGGVISIPEWKLFGARSENAVSTRCRKPIFALFKKEFQLHQITLMGAAGLLVLHIGIIVLRKYHHFTKDSAGEVLTSIFWMLWLVMAPVIGSMAVAEERRLGVMDGQFCLPVSRRVQFAIKGIFTLFLGIFLGGVMPMLLEAIGVGLGANNAVLPKADMGAPGIVLFGLYLVGFAAWLVLVSFFASTLAKSFLQAVGCAIGAFFGCTLVIPAFTKGHMIFFDSISVGYILPLIIAVPTIIITLLWLAYLNFKNFRDGWPLWRRNLLGAVGAFIFIAVGSPAIHNRAWEVFEPAEPAHGPAKLSLSDPPVLHADGYNNNLLVQLPDGHVWFDYLNYRGSGDQEKPWQTWLRRAINPLPRSAGPQRFLSGSNWVSATAGHVDERIGTADAQKYIRLSGYFDSVGIQPDGTLWASGKPDQNTWTSDKLTRFGDETNWQQVVRSYRPILVLLLKKDGTLWRWGTNVYNWNDWPEKWPGLRAFQPYQIGTNSDWSKLFSGANPSDGCLAERTDGSVWIVTGRDKSRNYGLIRETNYDQIITQKFSKPPYGDLGTYIRKDGTLWLFAYLYTNVPDVGSQRYFKTLQRSQDTNWVSSALTWDWLVALKSDGTLWKWDSQFGYGQFSMRSVAPTRLGIHNDWVAITSVSGGVVSLAADGSLWFWPEHNYYNYGQTLLKLPKQPQFLGNIFGKAN